MGVEMVMFLTGPILNWLAGAGKGLLAHLSLSPSVEEADVWTLGKHWAIVGGNMVLPTASVHEAFVEILFPLGTNVEEGKKMDQF